MANANCDSCRFFDEHTGNGAVEQNDACLCRFKPPVSPPAPESKGLWPIIGASDWCGHFTPEMTAAE